MNGKCLDMQNTHQDWCSVTLDKPEAELFKVFLKQKGIRYYPSECGRGIYFSVYVSIGELMECNDFLDSI